MYNLEPHVKPIMPPIDIGMILPVAPRTGANRRIRHRVASTWVRVQVVAEGYSRNFHLKKQGFLIFTTEKM